MWRRLAQRTVAEVFDDGCTHIAAAVAYYALLSIFPLLILLVTVASLLVRHSQAAAGVASAVASTFPVAGPTISAGLQHLPGAAAGGVGFLGAAGLLWSASGVFGAMRDGINRAFDVRSTRPFVQRKLVDVAMAAGTGLFLVASTGAATALQVFRELAAHTPAIGRGLASLGALWTMASATVSALLALIVVTVLYRLVPARRQRVRDIWPGIVAGTLLLQATQYGFAFYVGSVSHYDVVYGSLGTIVAFMVWVYLASLALLIGAEVASEYPRVRASAVATSHRQREISVSQRVRGALLSLVKHQR